MGWRTVLYNAIILAVYTQTSPAEPLPGMSYIEPA